MKTLNWVFALFLPGVVLALSACGGSSSGSATLVPGAADSSGNAVVTLYIGDTPVDNASHVNIVFTGVEIQGEGQDSTGMQSGASEFDFDTPKNIDLMAHQGGDSAILLPGANLPEGNYQWIRLKIDPSQCTITLNDGSVHPLNIPSESQTGLKLMNRFRVAAGEHANFTIDFNLRQSVHMANGQYMMRPAMRMMNNQDVGNVRGNASNTLQIGNVAISDPGCSPAVYIYPGNGVTPVDINPGSSIQPVSTESLKLNNTSGNYDYNAGFLPPGTYTMAITCAGGDDPDANDTLAFSAPKTVTVTAGQTTEVDFP